MAIAMSDALPDALWADLVGKPFVRGGRGLETYDCFGLLAEMNRRRGIVIPDYETPEIQKEMAHALDSHKWQWEPCGREPGAAVSIRVGSYASHVGVVIDAARMIHAWKSSGGVTVVPLSMWERRIVGFYRFKGQA